jgi:hypothetical protein
MAPLSPPHVARHHAFGRHAAGGLAGLGAQLDAQQFFGLGHVAIGFGQGLLALHHGASVLARSSATMLAVIAAICFSSQFCSGWKSVQIRNIKKKGLTRAPFASQLSRALQAALFVTSTNSSRLQRPARP